MNRKLMVTGFLAACLAIVVLFTLSSCGGHATPDAIAGYSNYVSVMPDVTAEMLTLDFWLGKLKNPNAEIMSAEQVAELNRQGYDNVPWLNKLAEMDGTISGDALRASMDIPFPEGEYYIDKTPVTDEFWSGLKKNMNLEGARDINEVRYGFVTGRADVRSYPTDVGVTDESGDLSYDELQTSVSFIWEPVVIYHESLDKRFIYCATTTYFGWLSKSDVAVCRGKDEWLRAQEYADFLMVTGNVIKLDQNPYRPELSGIELYMGTKLPLVPLSEQPQSIYGRQVAGSYVVKVPVQGGDGYIDFDYLPIPVSRDVHVGYLPYTYTNVLTQLFKMQGDRYGWSGMLEARDCSSLAMELYRCFGIDLPRNGAWQEEYAGHRIDLTGLDAEEKEKILSQQVKPGALLRFPGHVMVYLGAHEGKHYVMSASGNVGEYSESEGGYVCSWTRTVLISSLDTKRLSGNSWLDDLTYVVCLTL